jgi:acyl-CoA synthetase (AMP-forming)/AMP-acid ligase II/acyl carrier protein
MQPDMTFDQSTLSDRRTIFGVVDHWADVHPDHPAIEYLPESGPKLVIDYRELRDRAMRVSTQLCRVCEAGDRVIMLLPPGPDFIVGFLGCLYAQLLAVPATEPKPRRLNDRLSRVVRDCAPSAVLTTAAVTARIDPSVVCPPLADIPWVCQDDNYLASDVSFGDAVGHRIDGGCKCFESEHPSVDPVGDKIAFLQYTSGSTSDPLGVAVSHRNLLHNLEMIRISFGQDFNHLGDRSLKGLFWLPPYHDMGLIGGILTPLYIGGTAILMPPTEFLKRPLSWLQAISQERALISGAPNFAYDLCASKADAAKGLNLDLSCWELAFCGAEPIRPETIDQFCGAYASSGFSRKSFYPCYGLAEATLLVSGNLERREPVIKTLDRRELELHRAVEIDVSKLAEAGKDKEEATRVVGCGSSVLDGEILIVNPDTRLPVGDRQIGEIWYRGANVAAGYWNQPEKSAKVFGAQLADSSDTAFLRTGDTGFYDDGQLFITGRLKEMLVIRGRNFYPHDLESTARSVDPKLIGGACAFAVESESTESLVLALEVDRQADESQFDQLISRARVFVAEVHEISPEAVLLVRPFSLPRTTSGKMQRLLARQMYARDRLKVLARWTRTPSHDAGNASDNPQSAKHPSESIRSGSAAVTKDPNTIGQTESIYQPLGEGRVSHLADEIERWLCSRLITHGSLAPEEVTPDRPLAEYGLDSMATLQLAGEIEDHYKITLNPIAMWNYPTSRHLARYLAEQIVGEFGDTYAVDEDVVPGKTFEAMLREIELMDDQEVLRRLGSL